MKICISSMLQLPKWKKYVSISSNICVSLWGLETKTSAPKWRSSTPADVMATPWGGRQTESESSEFKVSPQTGETSRSSSRDNWDWQHISVNSSLLGPHPVSRVSAAIALLSRQTGPDFITKSKRMASAEQALPARAPWRSSRNFKVKVILGKCSLIKLTPGNLSGEKETLWLLSSIIHDESHGVTAGNDRKSSDFGYTFSPHKYAVETGGLIYCYML